MLKPRGNPPVLKTNFKLDRSVPALPSPSAKHEPCSTALQFFSAICHVPARPASRLKKGPCLGNTPKWKCGVRVDQEIGKDRDDYLSK